MENIKIIEVEPDFRFLCKVLDILKSSPDEVKQTEFTCPQCNGKAYIYCYRYPGSDRSGTRARCETCGADLYV